MGIAKKQTGFTIVELLIVVIIIAILATITIVGFNGIQNRAKQSAAASTLSQAHKAIAAWRVDNSDILPTDLSQVSGLDADSDWEYRRFDNNTQFCISAVQRGTAYYLNSTQSGTVAEGRCSDAAIIPGAGVPLGTATQDATSATLSSPLTGTPDITMYAVINVTAIGAASWNASVGLRSSEANQSVQLGQNGAGSNAMRYRIDTPAVQNVTSAKAGVRSTLGRHIGWVQISSSGTVRSFNYDSPTPHTTLTLSPGTGWNFTGIALNSTDSTTEPIMATVYGAAHDEQTRARVMQWIADTYNVPMSF